MTHRQFAEAFQIGGQPPRKLIVDADAAISIHGRDY
jgi:hypothetical protein